MRDAEIPTEKLQKVLANTGLGSRRQLEQWIAAGRVSVNDVTATLGDRVTGNERIKVDGKPISLKTERHRTILYNKPAGQICSRNDPDGRPSVFDKLPKLKKQRWICVGRLDFNTSGLLLFTTDGELANRLMHPSFQVEREYVVRVVGEVTNEKLQNMRDGVALEDGTARFTDIQRSKEEHDSLNQWYYVVLMEGRNREVRRLWESQGLKVSRLKRVRYGNLFIPSAVTVGRFVDLKSQDAKDLYRMVGLKTPRRPRDE